MWFQLLVWGITMPEWSLTANRCQGTKSRHGAGMMSRQRELSTVKATLRGSLGGGSAGQRQAAA